MHQIICLFHEDSWVWSELVSLNFSIVRFGFFYLLELKISFSHRVFVIAVQHPGVQLAKVKVDADFTAPCNSSILYPADGGNMHRFTALTACAVLDVLGPPYSDPEGRDCTYYFDFPFTNFSGTMSIRKGGGKGKMLVNI